MKQFDFVGNEWYPVTAASDIRNWLGRRPALFILLLCLLLGAGAATPAQASHYRYGTLTWRTVPADPTKLTVEFKVSRAYRRSATAFANVTVGSTVSAETLDFGDGTTGSITLTVTSLDIAGGVFYGEASIVHTYAAAGNYQAFFSSCCRLSTLANNADGTWYVSTLVNAGSGNSSPVSTVSPVVNLATGQAAASFLLPASDPDGDALTFSLATLADFNGNAFTNAPGLAVNAATGLVTFATTGLAVGQMYNAIIKVSDGRTSILVDFLLNITGSSNAPVFDYSVTPPNGFVYRIAPGQPLAFGVRATDGDPGDTVRLQAFGLPVSATTAPAFPLSGNPVQTTFSWTPTAANLGTSVINFVARDLTGVQASTSVTVEVSLRPRFDVPPTPADHSLVQVTPGTVLSIPVQASSPVATDLVRIAGVAGAPAAMAFGPALPTAAANPTRTQLSWTPVLADWGPHAVTVTASNPANQQVTHTLDFVINSAPSFTSQPGGLTRLVGQAFTYSVAATDPDLPYGDRLAVVAPTLPAWLTLVDNGNGTATLSGTPGLAQVGTHHVVLEAEDTYHHGNSYADVLQAFDIVVAPVPAPVCALKLTATGTNVSCNGLRNGSIALAATGTTGALTFAWTGPNGYASTAQNPGGLAAGTYAVTARSTAGCSASAQVTITEPAVQMPQITCGSNVVVASPAGSCGAAVAYAVPVGSPGCRPVTTTRTAGLASGAVFPVGVTTVTYTATDDAGHATSCSFTVRVNDVTPPVVRTRAVAVALVNGVAVVTPAQVNNGSTDACGIATLSLSRTSFTCANLGANAVTLTATDVHGNVASAPAVVTVTGTPAPVTIRITRANNVYTSGPNTTVYLGYGAQSLQLTASGGTAYRWSPAAGLSSATVANPVFAPKAAGTYTYTVTATTAGGCSGQASVTLRVVDVRCGRCEEDDDDDHGDGDDHHLVASGHDTHAEGDDHGDGDHHDHAIKYKVLVCHNGHAICISPNAVPAHLLNPKHHDTLGNCGGIEPPHHGDGDDDHEHGDDRSDKQTAAGANGEKMVLEAFPNPFTTSAVVHFRALASAPAQVRVYDKTGRLLATLFDGVTERGRDYTLTLNDAQLSTGLYLCRFESQGQTQTQRLMVAK